ncbi:bacterial transcriptional activator domain-containing protein [Streptomyces europaeiscabiei]|uniref:bacterial transcriptional activator domain-containing protein n=1 Tax=Streptomyces europaeiscabiei TaxID=146819 RepID=UPI0038F7C0D6
MTHPPFPDASLLSRTERFLAEAAADPALQQHQYGDTVRLREQATAIDPLREVAWRVRMHAANALGDDDVLTAVQGCETALPQIDATPSPRTRKLAQAATAAAPCSAVGAAARRTWDPTCGQCQPRLAQPVSGRRPAPPAERGAFGSRVAYSSGFSSRKRRSTLPVIFAIPASAGRRAAPPGRDSPLPPALW